jgi:hypothetical protein
MAMATLHSETLDFLVHVLKTMHQKLEGAKNAAERKACKAEIDHLRKRITLEFYYQTRSNSAGESPQ